MTVIFHRSYVAKAGKKSGPRGPRRQVTRTYGRLSSLAKTMGNALRADLVSGITTFKARVSPEELASAWAAGDYGKLFAAIPWGQLPADLAGATAKAGLTVTRASDIQIEKLPPNVNENLRFDVTNPRTRTFLQNQTGSLIANVQADTQQIVQNAVARSFTEAKTPDRVADEIRAAIGLAPRQERALSNYRAGLEAQGVDPERVDIFSEAYENRLLDQRAIAIARTETRAAIVHSQLAVWQEGVNQGLINKASAKKEWVVDGDPCETCDPMDGVRVGLDEPFMVEYPDGRIVPVYQMPAHTNCMCGLELHFTEEGEDE